MSKSNVVEFTSREGIDLLNQMFREGAARMLIGAMEAEVHTFLSQFDGQQTEDGRAAVVRNGYLPERELQTGIGPVTVKIPKVRSRTGEPVTFRSALVPPYVRKTQSLEAALPWLYLKGISTGEMESALKVLVGPHAQGLSATTVARLKQAIA